MAVAVAVAVAVVVVGGGGGVPQPPVTPKSISTAHVRAGAGLARVRKASRVVALCTHRL